MSVVMMPEHSRLSRSATLLWGGVALVVVLMYWDGLTYLVKQWIANEEYSHGFLIPLVAFYLLWQNRLALQRLDYQKSWLGVAVVLAGLALFLVGERRTQKKKEQKTQQVVLAGLILAFGGLA